MVLSGPATHLGPGYYHYWLILVMYGGMACNRRGVGTHLGISSRMVLCRALSYTLTRASGWPFFVDPDTVTTVPSSIMAEIDP